MKNPNLRHFSVRAFLQYEVLSLLKDHPRHLVLLTPTDQQNALTLIKEVTYESVRRLSHHCFNIGDKRPLRDENPYLEAMMTQLGYVPFIAFLSIITNI